MKQNTLVGLIIGLLVVGGIFFYVTIKPSLVKAPEIVPAPALSGTSFVEHTQYYDIAANYASSTPLLSLGEAVNAKAVSLMLKFISDTIEQFKTDGNFTNLTQEDIKMMGFDQGKKETLEIKYLISSSPHTISYIFTVYEDTLGAHGNTFFKTFTFDTTTGAPLALADLFTSGSDYLSTLSQISRAKLPSVIGTSADATFINPGTTPDDKNFENFFIDNKNIDILFAPYAVAPYAAGPQTLQIPLTTLSNVLKPEYR